MASVHWLTVTVHLGALEAATVPLVRELVASAFGVTVESWLGQGHGGRRYDRIERLAGHAVALYSEPQGAAQHCSVDVSGTACETLSVPGCLWLLAQMDSRGWRWSASRVDLAVDGVPFTPLQFADAVERGDVRTWCKVDNADSFMMQWSGRGEAKAHTVYLGHAQSERRLRVYDRRGFTRVELQLRGDHAKALCKALTVVDFAGAVVGSIRAYVDLVDRFSDGNVSRRELLPFWAAWVDGVVAFRVQLVKPETTLESASRWVEQSLAPMLSAVLRARGRDGGSWLTDLLMRDGPARWGPRHRALLAQARGAP